jgi:hypothetical protein
VEKSLQNILENNRRSKGNTEAIDGIGDGSNHVRRRLENVGEHNVQKVKQSVFTAKTGNS